MGTGPLGATGESDIGNPSGGRAAADDGILRALAQDRIAVEEVRALDNPHSPVIGGYRLTIKGRTSSSAASIPKR